MAKSIRVTLMLVLALIVIASAGCSLTHPFAPSRPTPKLGTTHKLNKTPSVAPGTGMSELQGELSRAVTAVKANNWALAGTHINAADVVWRGIKALPHDTTTTKVSSEEHAWSTTDIKAMDTEMTQVKQAANKKDKTATLDHLTAAQRLATKYLPTHDGARDKLPVGMGKPKAGPSK